MISYPCYGCQFIRITRKDNQASVVKECLAKCDLYKEYIAFHLGPERVNIFFQAFKEGEANSCTIKNLALELSDDDLIRSLSLEEEDYLVKSLSFKLIKLVNSEHHGILGYLAELKDIQDTVEASYARHLLKLFPSSITVKD